MEAIAEENRKILKNKTGKANKPFDWGEVGNKLAKLAKAEYEKSREKREQYLREWAERDRHLKGRPPTLISVSQTSSSRLATPLRRKNQPVTLLWTP